MSSGWRNSRSAWGHSTRRNARSARRPTRWRPWQIDVYGSDLSRQAVRTAAEALYCDFGMGAFRDLVAAVAWNLPGVRDVRTYAVMEELKNTSALPVRGS